MWITWGQVLSHLFLSNWFQDSFWMSIFLQSLPVQSLQQISVHTVHLYIQWPRMKVPFSIGRQIFFRFPLHFKIIKIQNKLDAVVQLIQNRFPSPWNTCILESKLRIYPSTGGQFILLFTKGVSWKYRETSSAQLWLALGG